MHPDSITKKAFEDLSEAGSTFLLIYAYRQVISDENVCKITSNASAQGQAALLGHLLRPTHGTVEALTMAFLGEQALASGVEPDKLAAYVENIIQDPFSVPKVEACRARALALAGLLPQTLTVEGHKSGPAPA
jgi:hypothetical protein